MEQIYTIPVNEVFGAEEAQGCPMCALRARLEENELSLILGASMMEPDVRVETNRRGFCEGHYKKMFGRKNRLGLALILESHLSDVREGIVGGGLAAIADPALPAVRKIASLDGACYICTRVNFHLDRMFETVALLFGTDPAFPARVARQKYFCLPHYRKLLETAKRELTKKQYAEFYKTVAAVENGYAKELNDDVSWFVKKFDYRYTEEPWYNAKDAVERSIRFLTGDGEMKDE